MPGFPQIGEEEAQNKIKQNKQNKTIPTDTKNKLMVAKGKRQ